MYRFFVKHKLSIDDITHLSDSDSEFVINQLRLKIESFVEIETYEAIYLGVITDISKSSVEVEILERITEKEVKDNLDITLVQSLIGKNKFNFFLEKAVEIGVDRVIPIESQYSTISKNKAIKEHGLWRKIIKDATEQSRNMKPTVVEDPINLDKLEIEKTANRICLSTENVKYTSLREYLNEIDINKPFVIAIGPEKGWGSKDIEYFKKLDFTFIKLKGNILRTESVGLIVGSIIKYLKGDI
jgi:16S rRNA (uracil1498-N3)-methyltransferase